MSIQKVHSHLLKLYAVTVDEALKRTADYYSQSPEWKESPRGKRAIETSKLLDEISYYALTKADELDSLNSLPYGDTPAPPAPG